MKKMIQARLKSIQEKVNTLSVNAQGVATYEDVSTKQSMIYALFAVAIAFVFLMPAVAGTGGTEFNDLVDMVVGWSEGGLGKALAVTAFLLGGAIGMVRSTMLPMIIGLGFGLGFTMGPGIIQGMFTALV